MICAMRKGQGSLHVVEGDVRDSDLSAVLVCSAELPFLPGVGKARERHTLRMVVKADALEDASKELGVAMCGRCREGSKS